VQFRRVGESGLVVSAIGFGCNNLGRAGSPTEEPDAAIRVVHAAVDAGITYFDTADIYGKTPGLSERYLGQALKSVRDQVVVGTKFGMDMQSTNGPDFDARGSRRYIIAAVEASLERLCTDYIDLLQYHTPDPYTPIDETLAALDQLIADGKVRYIGHSNFSGWQLAQAEYVARNLGTERFISAQNHYNLMDRRAELEVLPASRRFGLGLFPYFPLNNGLLTGKYSRCGRPEGARLTYVRQHMVAEADWEQLEKFSDFAQQRGLNEIELAFGWLAAQEPISSVIAGATRVEQVQQNANSLANDMSAEDLEILNGIFPPADQIALYYCAGIVVNVQAINILGEVAITASALLLVVLMVWSLWNLSNSPLNPTQRIWWVLAVLILPGLGSMCWWWWIRRYYPRRKAADPTWDPAVHKNLQSEAGRPRPGRRRYRGPTDKAR